MIQRKSKRNRLKNIKERILLGLFICMGTLLVNANTVSASTHLEETKRQIIDNIVGRYELNYTGNTNHYTTWFNTGDVEEQKIYNDLGNAYFNSSSAYLTSQSEDSTIKHAFLVWQSRTTEKEGYTPMEVPVKLILPNGTDINISPQYIIKDNRNNWDGKNYENYASMCTMVTDVTSIVSQSGFGKYSVCNIPMWEPSDASGFYMEGRYVCPGGDSPGSWQLVIVEENKNFNVRAVSLSITSEFHLGTDFTGQLRLENDLKSATTGNASGQFLFGLIRSTEGEHLVEHISTKDSNGNLIADVTRHTIDRPGLFRDGLLQNNRDSAFGGACIDLTDIEHVGNGATSADLYVENGTLWTSFTMLGASFDVSYPDFEGMQTTTVNDDVTEVTVEGSFKNIAIPADTGIYDGFLEIIVDPELTPISATAKVNGTPIATAPIIEGNVVKFMGNEVKNMMNGDDISYTVLCTANSAGALAYKNEARFNGRLRSEGANTGYWVNQIWIASSEWEREVYKITLNNQNATLAGTLRYFEWYNDGNYTTEGCIQSIDTITVPTKDNYNFNGYYTGTNGTGTKYVAADGKILSDATTFTADTTLYAYWTPKIYKITLDNQGANNEGTICFYEKYGVGNYADEDCMVPIFNINQPTKDGCVFAGYWTTKDNETNGLCITTEGTIGTPSTYFANDTTIYAHWNPETYTITLDNQGATASGSTKFYELYNTRFYYDAVTLTNGTTDIPFNYTGGVQYFIAPYTGNYYLNVYGAQGGTYTNVRNVQAIGGYGGYSSGAIYLTQGDTLYVFVGGKGGDAYHTELAIAGYNGGGNGHGEGGANWGRAGGGGATDIRKYGTTYNNRIIVAGGGGGGATYGNVVAVGGNGGGLNFEPVMAVRYHATSAHINTDARTNDGVYGEAYQNGGGGGGYYGGGDYIRSNYVTGGEGGIGYIGGVTNGTSVAGVHSGNGYAVITRSNYTIQYTATTKIEPPTKDGYYFRGYFTGKNGSGTAITDSQGNIMVEPDYFTSDATVYAYWATSAECNYTIRFNGNGATSGSMTDMKCSYGQAYTLTPNAYKKDGYHFVKWTTNPDGSGQAFTDKQSVKNLTSVGGAIVDLYAQWESNSYTITFHPNDATEVTHIDDIIVKYDDMITLPDMMLPDGTYYYVKYTLDGVDITDQVLSKEIVLAMDGTVVYQEEPLPEETDIAEVAEVAEVVEEAEPQPNKKAYASVFTGWSLEDGKDDFIPRWNAGEMPVSDIADVAGMTNQDGATITIYAIWDDCPWIEAVHLYYTLEQAQSGFITDTEIMSHATAYDREDGSPIEPGFHENGTSFSIPDYTPTDFTQFTCDGCCTENLTVVDSAGSMYAKQIKVYVVDTTPRPVKPEATSRFINEYYYNQPYENGGLAEDSVWLTDPEYVEVIQDTFENIRNDTPEATYYFTHEEILEMKAYIDEHGIYNTREEGALEEFYYQFIEPNKQEE